MPVERPRIAISNRQRMVRVRLAGLREFAQEILARILRLPRRRSGVLTELGEVNVILVSDRRIAELHRQFMNEPGPTDVITFQHGEIFVSTETAKRQARSYGNSLEHELRLYIVHGLLHLHGFDDKTTAGSARMKRLQEQIVGT